MGHSFSLNRRRCGLCYFELDKGSAALKEPTVFRSYHWQTVGKSHMEGQHGPLDEAVPAQFRDDPVYWCQVHIRTHFHALQVSQARGCRGCDALLRLIHSACEDDGVVLDSQSRKEDIYLAWRTTRREGESMNLWIKFTVHLGDRTVTRFRSDGRGRWTLHFDVDQIGGKRIKRNHHPFPGSRLAIMRGNTGSEESMERIKVWLKDCNTSHHSCTYNPDTPLPKRVLEVTSDAQGNIVTRLVQDLDLRVKYICLSHRWGPSTLLCRTTKDTLAEHLQSVPWTKLPKSFQDAATVTHRLGIRYIWIDSLCIIQDDTTDWLEQAAQMCDIYSNSYVTLAAAWSEESATGLFRTSTSYAIEAPPRLGHRSPSYAIQRSPDHLDWPGGPLKMMKEFPLLSRAWVYQERFLSPRVVYFTRYEVALGCETSGKKSCECGKDTSNDMWVEGRSRRGGRYLEMPERLAFFEIKSSWHMMISDYSRLHITYESDRLPALAGVARRYGTLNSAYMSDYVVGMWRSWFPADLLWFCSGYFKESLQRYNCGPTWSWITVGRGVDYVSTAARTYPDDFDVINVDFKLQGPDPYGAISDAVLEVEGYLVPGTLLKQEATEKELAASVFKASAGDPFRFLPDYALHDSGPDILYINSQIFCMKTGVVVAGAHICLLLSRVETISDTYKRIGLTQDTSKANVDLMFTDDIKKQRINII